MIKYFVKTICLVAFLFSLSPINAQPKKYTKANAHSHNDYLNEVPFFKAYNNHFGSIEADIFPVNGQLVVAHHKTEIDASRTLESLYIQPLLKEISTKSKRRLKLLIDIKEDYKQSLQLLLKDLEPLEKYLCTLQDKKKPIIILISGERPPPAEYKNYPAYIFFDDDLKLKHTSQEWQRVGQVSLQFTKFTSFKGLEPLNKKDFDNLQHTIDSVHHAGKTIRFWAAPDNEASWKLQKELGVDLIGTDKIEELATFLKRKK